MTQYKYDDTMKFRFTKNSFNEYHSFDDKPSFEYLDGSIISWHKNGLLHRIDKPALIRTLINGKIVEEYYNNGKLYIPNIKIQSFIHDNKFKISNEDNLIIIDDNEDKLQKETENGGFNKKTDVPELLRKYIGLDEDDKKSRPELTKLLNAKFNETGLIKIKTLNDKEIKMIILDKATAKKLNRTEGDEIRSKDIQTFIVQFYRELQTINT
jgi:hypothetical protein